MYKFDFHIHTTISSSCSILKPYELIEEAIKKGLDGIGVTEHNTIYGALKVREIVEKENIDLVVIEGMEVRTNVGDVLVFGLYEEDNRKLEGIDIRKLYELVDKVRGLMIPAHPFRQMVFSIGEKIYEYAYMFNAIEGFNFNASMEENLEAIKVSLDLNLPITASSDAHTRENVGLYYTMLYEKPQNTREFIDIIKSKKFTLPDFLKSKILSTFPNYIH